MAGIFDSTSDENGGGGIWDSPVAMMLLPRVSSAMREAKKQNFLMAQLKRKTEMAGKLADQLDQSDPMAAAMLRADPSTLDNVFSAYYGAQKAREQAAQGYKYDILKQENQSELAMKQKEAENMLPGAVGDYQLKKLQELAQTVQRDGMLGPAYPKAQGPAPAGQLQQGQTLKDITPEMMRIALSQDYNLPNLGQGEANRIMTDPKAPQDLMAAAETKRNNDLTAGGRTQVIEKNGKRVRVAQNSQTGAWDVEVGNDPMMAEEISARTKTLPRKNPEDGKWHNYGFDLKTGDFTRDEGLANTDPTGQRATLPLVQQDGSIHSMGWDGEDYTIDYGIAPNNMGDPVRDPVTNEIIGLKKAATGGDDKPSVDQSKGQALLTGIESSVENIAETWPSLSEGWNKAASAADQMGGNTPLTHMFTGFMRTSEGRQARDSVTQIAQSYVYALSGQQAPDQEVARLSELVFPNASDDKDTVDLKERRLADMINTIKVKAAGGVDMTKRKDAVINPKLRVADPDGSSGHSLSEVTRGPVPDYLKEHTTQEKWDAATPAMRKKLKDAFKPPEE
jgi:hypothetical protein